MNILVTGAAGFIGSHLVRRLLDDGHRVTGVDDLSTGKRENLPIGNPMLRFYEADVQDEDAIMWLHDRIYSLACPASPKHYQAEPVDTIRTCFFGTLHALQNAARSKGRMLLASTSEVYGDAKQHPQREDYWGHVNPVGPRSMYDEGKRAAEALATAWARTHRTDVRIARIFNTYGPRMSDDDGRMIPNFVTQALKGVPLTIYGDGRQTRSLCYVDDMVEGLVRLMESDAGPAPVNLGNPDERTVNEVASAVLRATIDDPSRWQVEHFPLPEDDPKQRCPDIARARTLLGWEPKVTLGDGLRRTVEWFKEKGR